MRIILDLRGGSFLYAHACNKAHDWQQFISESLITYQISGLTEIINEQGETKLKEGQLVLARRNQFIKSTKIPIDNKKCQCVSVILSLDRLQQFALDNGICCQERYVGDKLILMEPNEFLKTYFSSIISYSDLWTEESKKLATIKVYEVIELLLEMNPDFKAFLFDFVDPVQQDLEVFMLENYRYNVSLEQFANLSGRSLTVFKRDFAEIFKIPPAEWLKNKRLTEAYNLIKDRGMKSDDIYHDLGFENLSHFYTAFKQKYGMTPSQIKAVKCGNSEKVLQ
jgi:AraC-like DNA-binding protein